jgi:hypothetical protein
MRVSMWVKRQEPELRVVDGQVEISGVGTFYGQVEAVQPLDDLTDAERAKAAEALVEAERADDRALLQRVLYRGGVVLL